MRPGNAIIRLGALKDYHVASNLEVELSTSVVCTSTELDDAAIQHKVSLLILDPTSTAIYIDRTSQFTITLMVTISDGLVREHDELGAKILAMLSQAEVALRVGMMFTLANQRAVMVSAAVEVYIKRTREAVRYVDDDQTDVHQRWQYWALQTQTSSNRSGRTILRCQGTTQHGEGSDHNDSLGTSHQWDDYDAGRSATGSLSRPGSTVCHFTVI